MTRVAICISVLLLLVAASVGASGVTNIELNKAGGFTTARIDIDGKIRFTHQTEEAKDGRPFRVIVDILSATHELGAKEFSGLPKCLIEGIRTSQFSVTPEQVVRIVFDMKSSPTYRVEPNNNSISVFFTDQSGPDFGPWSSTAWVNKTQKKVAPKQHKSVPPVIAHSDKGVAKSAAAQNKAIATDRLASLAGASKPVPKTADKPSISKASVQRAAKVKVPQKPEIDAKLASLAEPPAVQSEQTARTKPKSATDTKKKVVSKQVHSKWTAEPAPAPSTKLIKKSLAALSAPKAPKKADAKPKNKIKPSSGLAAKSSVKVGTGPLQGPPPPPVSEMAKPKVASIDTKAKPKASVAKAKPTPQKQSGTKAVAHQQSKPSSAKKVVARKTQPVKTKEIAKAPKVKKTKVEKTKVASITKDSKPASKEKSTSRFRRKPVVSNKIRGTLVAEFPKRLTIKYRARSSHDPFETLINENRRYNEPIGKQVPNVEGLRLVGVIESDNGKNSALFEDKDGYGYILQSGDKVRKGYVLRVELDRVYFQIFEYGWSRTLALKMEEY